MKVYIQFFNMSCGPWPDFKEESKELIEACGDRSVINIDARLTQCNIRQIAEHECIKRKYLAYQVLKGSSLLNAKPVGNIIEVNQG